ncbi:MAG TPA: hypothetical protein VFT22_36385 [Kofleriaceae bacterium]|nr:hypothetical protein [Kofleriaceae bacterium]
MMTPAWNDAYHELWNQAAHHRGVLEAFGESPDPALHHLVPQWPRTSGSDVVAIAAVIDSVLRAMPRESGGHGVERRWRRCMSDLYDAALRDPRREYPHNRDFWSALTSVVAYLVSIDAPVPEATWQTLLAELGLHAPSHAGLPAEEPHLELMARRYDELWRAQKNAMAERRGADLLPEHSLPRDGQMVVPRTTNADVLQLGMYWYNALARVYLARRAMGPAGIRRLESAGVDGALRRVLDLFADLDRYAVGQDPDATYPGNEDFWRATASLAVTLAAVEAAPPLESEMDARLDPPSAQHRNASYPGEGTFETRWDQLHDDLARARGFDTRDPLPGRVGRPMKIPRTQNGEIVQLAEHWNAAWKKLEGRRGILGNLTGEEIGLDTLEKRWKAVMQDVREVAQRGKAEDVYPKNHEFWRETLELAVTLDVYNEAPTRLDLATDVARSLPDRFADVVGQIAHAVGDVAHKAGEGLTSGIGKQLLLGGGVVLGGILLWRLARHPGGA